MKAMKHILVLLTMLILSVVAVSAQSLPIDFDNAEFQANDVVLERGETTSFSLSQGSTFDVEYVFEALEDIRDLGVTGIITGDDTVGTIVSEVRPRNYDAGTRNQIRLLFNLPNDIDRGNFKIRLLFTDRNSDTHVEEREIFIDALGHRALVIDDIIFSPNVLVEGSYLLGTVRVENKGEGDEDSVKVILRLPEYGVEGVDYIDEIEENEEEQTEDILLTTKACSRDGKTPTETLVEAEVIWGEGYFSTKEIFTIPVVASDSCSLSASATSKEAMDEKDNMEESETQVVVKTEVYAQPPVVDKESYGQDRKGQKEGSAKAVLEVILIILLVILIIVGIVVGVSRLKEGSDEDDDEEF